MPIVIKADGLAAGKGVYICKDVNEAIIAIKEVFDGKFGYAEKLLIESPKSFADLIILFLKFFDDSIDNLFGDIIGDLSILS